jgi:hypothetical protein
MARFDKYDPLSGGSRGPLNADMAKGVFIGVGINSSGRVVVGAGQTGIVGVVAATRAMVAGDIIDIMRSGEVVEFAGAAGTVYTANTTTGVISAAAASATQVPIGYTIEATRLVVSKSAAPFDAVV